ncbi:MAG: hypothetical protein KAQ81_01180 [Deltaproteobacteria bacterium]|nr:hypothetical protein [Deltaproteobacteria bacterium]MBW2651614.1 hypothetical protein [Deltaproteobacteria bacterium]MCK5254605.1 hypothetical protein [Deltaproteobacteria bacterium]NOQ85686.1 hypothetical protein [Deltaproteobacteria bacterium]
MSQTKPSLNLLIVSFFVPFPKGVVIVFHFLKCVSIEGITFANDDALSCAWELELWIEQSKDAFAFFRSLFKKFSDDTSFMTEVCFQI